MKRLLQWVSIAAGTLVGVLLIGYGVLYFLSERVMNRQYPIPAVSISIPTNAEAIVEGRRLAIARGCLGGCHGKQGEGRVMFDKPMIARIVAPNLTAAVRKYTDAELVVAIRNGVRPDGRSMIAMPSEAFVALTDQDVGRIIAFLKSLPAIAGAERGVSPGPLGRLGIVTGKFKPIAQLIAESGPPPEAKSEEARFGRYLAQTTCAGCHAPDLRGDSNPSFTSPDLRVVAAYSPEAFTQLLRTGVRVGGSNAGVMSEWSRAHLSRLTDNEIAALYFYLRAMPGATAK